MIPKYLNYTVTPADLRNMSEENVIELMIFTDRDCKFCSNGTPILKLAVHPF